MKKIIIVAVVVIVTAAAGVAGAYGASRWLVANYPANTNAQANTPGLNGAPWNFRGEAAPFGQPGRQGRQDGAPWGNRGRNNATPRGYGAPGQDDNAGRNYGKGFDKRQQFGPGMMGRQSFGQGPQFGPGMMGGQGFGQGQPASGERIALDKAVQQVEDYVQKAGANFKIAEIMEFDNNFYAAVVEKDSGKGAFEVLVDPISGLVIPEMGPNMMWNAKYGHMRFGSAAENTITMEAAASAAQKQLDTSVPGAKVSPDGLAFYGYYTFDYEVEGKVAGMLSVNGSNSQVWLHTWHGKFIAEKGM